MFAFQVNRLVRPVVLEADLGDSAGLSKLVPRLAEVRKLLLAVSCISFIGSWFCSQEVCDDRYERWIVLHNAGTLGRIGISHHAEPTPQAALQRDVCLNLTSFISLNEAVLLRHRAAHPLSLVNVSSLAAVAAMPRLAQYCTWKSARDMFMACVANDYRDTPTVTTLNYAPGSMRSDMTHTLATSVDMDPVLRGIYAKHDREVCMHRATILESCVHERLLLLLHMLQGTYVDMAASAAYCAQCVMDNTGFTSGQHIDFMKLDISATQRSR